MVEALEGFDSSQNCASSSGGQQSGLGGRQSPKAKTGSRNRGNFSSREKDYVRNVSTELIYG